MGNDRAKGRTVEFTHRFTLRLRYLPMLAVASWCIPAFAQQELPEEASAPEGETLPAPALETVVQGSSRPPDQPVEDEAASASVVTRERTPRSAESVEQLLSELPGVTVTRLGGLGSLSTVSLRGSSSNQVAIYLDGVPLHSFTGSGVDLSMLSLGNIERIEVYRGMSPIGFGESALGGVVSITTRVPTENTLSAEAGGGSFATLFGDASGSWVAKPLRLYGGIHFLKAAGDFSYHSDNGTAFDPSDDRIIRRQNNDLAQVDGLVRGVLALPGRRELKASLSVFNRDQGVPGLGLYETREPSLSTVRLLGSVTYESREELGQGGRLRAQLHALRTRQRFRDPQAEVALIPTASRDTTSAIGGTARLSRPLGSRLKWVGVVDGRYEAFEPHDELRNDSSPSIARLHGAAGLEAQAWFPSLKLDVIPSARVELARDTLSRREQSGQAVSAEPPVTRVLPVLRLALIERPMDSLTLRANIGRYARRPSTTELYGNTGFLLGNPALVPESGINADIGAKLSGAHGPLRADLDIATFGARVEELIQFQQNAQGQARAINIGRARVLGVELSALLQAGRHWRLQANGTLTDAQDTSTVAASRGRQLPLRPRFQAYGRLELARVGLGQRLELGAYADADFTGGNYLDPANLVTVPSRFLFGAGFSLFHSSTRLRLVVSAQNLGNSRVNDLAGYPLPGHAFFTTLSWSSTSLAEGKDNNNEVANEDTMDGNVPQTRPPSPGEYPLQR
jgi:outer membrane cobalamin receptor